MATRVLILKATSDQMLDDIFRKKPTFKEIYPKIDADTIQIVKGIIEIDTNQGIKRKTVEMWTDEEAKLTGKPVNVQATMAYQMYNRKKYGKDWDYTYGGKQTINGSVAVIIPNYEQFEVDSL